MAVVVAKYDDLRYGDVVVVMPAHDSKKFQDDIGIRVLVIGKDIEIGTDICVNVQILEDDGSRAPTTHIPNYCFDGHFIWWNTLSEKEKFVIGLGGRLR